MSGLSGRTHVRYTLSHNNQWRSQGGGGGGGVGGGEGMGATGAMAPQKL